MITQDLFQSCVGLLPSCEDAINLYARGIYNSATMTTNTFTRVPMQFIAALGDPNSCNGVGATEWGIWRQDPGPRGVSLDDYQLVSAMGGFTPAGWTLDPADWWMEENGLVMEKPDFPLPSGRYIVTGGRETQASLFFVLVFQ